MEVKITYKDGKEDKATIKGREDVVYRRNFVFIGDMAINKEVIAKLEIKE